MRARLTGLLLAAAVALAGPAAAHLGLDVPPSRYGEAVLKEGPCGVAGGERGPTAAVFAPGEEIVIVWNEYVDHPGHFRVAFDADGDDDFVDPRCLGACATRAPLVERYANGSVLLDGIADTAAGGRTRIAVTLPDVECERCTLQVIQVMYDKPPFAVPGNDIYYQCADVALRRGAAPGCPGDCDGDGRVGVDELIVALRIALALEPVAACGAADLDGDGRVGIDEIVRAVGAALDDCGS